MSVLSLHFGFRGRINRKTYWLAGIVPFFAIELGVFLFGISLEFFGAFGYGRAHTAHSPRTRDLRYSAPVRPICLLDKSCAGHQAVA